MPRTAFHAWLNGAEFASVRDLLRAWLQTDDFVIQDRLSGTDIAHEADGLYVYCQEGVATGDGRPNYLMEGTIDAAPEAAAERLRPLLTLSAARHIELTLEYALLDEHDREVGEEYALR